MSGAVFAAELADDGPGLAAAQDSLALHLGQVGVQARAASRAAVIVEEVVRNAFRHGGASRLRLAAAADASSCTLRFADDGVAFDPASAPEPPRAQRLDDPTEGGRGLLLLRRFASHLAYERSAGENRLTVRLALP